MSLMAEDAAEAAVWVDDLVKLPELNADHLLANLRLGYKDDEIYTYVGPVLISINPYKRLPIYSPELIAVYRDQQSRSDNKPHVYTIAAMAYTGLVMGMQNQSILVSGESGAGKTEVNKVILSYLTTLSGGGSHIEEQILAANPILEAFGNAKTMRNNNSSRFGKYTKLFFKNARIEGASIERYLLEKSRVVQQSEGDRNYHIFYHLLAGGGEFKEKFGLTNPQDYYYVNQSSAVEIPGFDDAKEFKDVCEAMSKYKFSAAEQESMWGVLAAILHIGNIQFQFNDSIKRMEPTDKNLISRVAGLLGLAHPQILEIVLTTRKMTGGGRKSTYSISNTAEEVVDFRDALAKHLYSRVFDWLVAKINSRTANGDPDDPSRDFIGVLDIFGFEIFEQNSFEQLLINFANEKLHQQFLEFMFKVEQEEYTKEGVSWSSVEFEDNKPCVDLIEAKFGVLSMLDEECLMPKGDDNSYLQKLEDKHRQHKHYAAQKRGKSAEAKLGPGFSVHHFAYPVYYEVEGFVYKNKDRLYPDLEGALARSKTKFVQQLFPTEAEQAKQAKKAGHSVPQSGGKKKAPSLGGTFKNQLGSLYKNITSTQPHYIRCIKPNPQQQANLFDNEYIARQLAYVGVMETIRIRKAGYSLRTVFKDFIRRFSAIDPASAGKQGADRCKSIIAKAGVVESDYAIGKSKIFMRDAGIATMERLVKEALTHIVLAIQQAARGLVARRAYVDAQAAYHKAKEEDLKRRREAMCACVIPAARAYIGRRSYEPMLTALHTKKEAEKQKRLEEERKRKEEEERKRKEEEERKRKEEEERLRKEEEERKRLEEEKQAAIAAGKAAEEKFKQEEEARKKAKEAEEKAKAEAEAAAAAAKKAEEEKAVKAKEEEKKKAEMSLQQQADAEKKALEATQAALEEQRRKEQEEREKEAAAAAKEAERQRKIEAGEDPDEDEDMEEEGARRKSMSAWSERTQNRHSWA